MSLGTYVIDANTVISAALKPASTPQAARSAARATGIIALSLAVYQKVAGVLSRPKFTRILTARRRMDTLELLLTKALWVEPVEAVTDCRDAKGQQISGAGACCFGNGHRIGR